MSIKKLGVSINYFDCHELIEPLILQIRAQVDGIYCLYQKKSYWGNPIEQEDLDELFRLKEIGLVDKIIEFKPDFSKYSREQECDKRNLSIEIMKQDGFSHILNIDSDEFYDAEQFRYAKDLINKKNYLVTYCQYCNYYKDLNHYLKYPFKTYVPFICSTFFNFKYDGPAPGPSDPTRRVNNPWNISSYVFEPEEIRMHHLSWCRKDIRKKLANWSAKNHFSDEVLQRAVDTWENWKEGDDATLLFNVPKNEVKICKLEQRLCGIQIPRVEEYLSNWKLKNGYV